MKHNSLQKKNGVDFGTLHQITDSRYDDEMDEEGRLLSEDEYVTRLNSRRDIFALHKHHQIKLIVAVSFVVAVLITTVLINMNFIELSADFKTNLRESSISLSDDISLQNIQRTERIQEQREELRPSHRGSAGSGGETGGGGDPRAQVTRHGVLGMISGAITGQSAASSSARPVGGYAQGIDAVLNGVGALSAGGGDGSGRESSAGIGFGNGVGSGFGGNSGGVDEILGSLMGGGGSNVQLQTRATAEFEAEEYDRIVENGFRRVIDEPLSTFSIDVDGASFSNTRRFLSRNQRPPVDAVRIEEFINYFNYDYPQPTGDDPFSITTEIDECPWNDNNKLVHIGLQGDNIDLSESVPSNIVFLLDVSGSMRSHDKLPLLKQSLLMLSKEMRSEDRIAIVVYAGAAGLVLPSTAATDERAIIRALNRLNAGGSTAGAAGIELAYKVAKENFIRNGNNRVILATDGDFNVGTSSQRALVQLIEKKRDEDIFLTVLGFGTGNYSDARMEQLANNGNGNYAYIDNILEAKKVLVNEMGGTLYTIAKDVKLQIEFNPAQVSSYRLIGYENRLLANEDFNDDTKDAGELGAGHTVTALYEVVPVGAGGSGRTVDPLKYQQQTVAINQSSEILTVKFRYKEPNGDVSRLISQSLTEDSQGSTDLDWATAMASFGMLLRGSEHSTTLQWEEVLALAKSSRGRDENGYRSEAIRMIERAEILYN